MTHKPIKLNDISFVLPHKTCFSSYSAVISHGQRIGVMGKNGSGKSTLIKMLALAKQPSNGDIVMPKDVSLGYVPQMIEEFSSSSGAERFNRLLSQAFAHDPNLLLMDEPTNHLDKKNRSSLRRMLKAFPHTLIMATHDVELLRESIDIIWHIDEGAIKVFVGGYDDYVRELNKRRASIEKEIGQVNKKTKNAHLALMKEQKRAKNSRLLGEKNIEQRKWPTVVSSAKARRAEETSGRKKSELKEVRGELLDQLSKLRLPEVLKPKFHLAAPKFSSGVVVSVKDGAVGYSSKIVKDINLSVAYGYRLAIKGDNGSGKSTLMKALINHPSVNKTGVWKTPSGDDIGYLGQHYENLSPHKTVLDNILELRPTWQQSELRQHLNDFLFRKNEEVNALVKTLSGGEKARLSLCKIASYAPRLLLLDEITNNVDLDTRQHLIQVLKAYEGALIVISHDEDFLSSLAIDQSFFVNDRQSLGA